MKHEITNDEASTILCKYMAEAHSLRCNLLTIDNGGRIMLSFDPALEPPPPAPAPVPLLRHKIASALTFTPLPQYMAKVEAKAAALAARSEARKVPAAPVPVGQPRRAADPGPRAARACDERFVAVSA